jgi:hypothetical protein
MFNKCIPKLPQVSTGERERKREREESARIVLRKVKIQCKILVFFKTNKIPTEKVSYSIKGHAF